MNNLVSIIHSYYNGEEYLKGFLDNVYNQTIKNNIQLVFVGCLLSDNEKEILNSYSDKINMKQILLEELKTQSECWNIAIKESDSDYCCIWNVDDIRTKNSIENQYNFLKKNDNIDCVYGMFIISNKYNNKYGKLIDHSIYEYSEHKQSFLLGPFFMFKKSFCYNNNIFFDEQLKVCSDFSFALHLMDKGKIALINSIDGYFLDEQKGLSTKGDNKQPIERTYLEIKWDINHKIDQNFVPLTKHLNFNKEKYFGIWNDFTKMSKQ